MLPASKYLPYFVNNKEKISSTLELTGDLLLVERVRFPEKRVGSIFIADSRKVMTGGFTTETPEFFRVLFVGKGYYDEETGKDVPLDINQGDIVYLPAASVKIWSSFPLLETTDSDVLGITRHGDVQIRWKSEKEFIEYLTGFNQAVKEEMAKAGQ